MKLTPHLTKDKTGEIVRRIINDAENLELKPEDDYNLLQNVDQRFANRNKVERINKEKMNVQLKENIIICDNILQKFFALDDEKFYACLIKLNEWGFDTTFKEFIIHYFLKITKDNYLKNYIMMNMGTILGTLKTQLELKMMEGMKNFDFATIQDEKEIEILKNEIVGKESALINLTSPDFNEFAPVEAEDRIKLSPSKKKDFRMEVLNRLRYENPGLLD